MFLADRSVRWSPLNPARWREPSYMGDMGRNSNCCIRKWNAVIDHQSVGYVAHQGNRLFASRDFRESSVIADIYGRKRVFKVLMNGVYGAKTSRLSALFQVGQLVDLVTHFSGEERCTSHQRDRPDYLCLEIPNHPSNPAMATFMIELVQACDPAIKLPIANCFNLFKRCIIFGHQGVADPNFHLKFMVRLSALLGFQLQNNFGGENESFDLILNAVFTSYNERDPYHMHPSLESFASALLGSDRTYRLWKPSNHCYNGCYSITVDPCREFRRTQIASGL